MSQETPAKGKVYTFKKSNPNIPQSIEAEQAFLGGVIQDDKAWNAYPNLTGEDFFEKSHRLIFEAFARLMTEGGRVDVVTLGEFMQSSGTLQAAGGFEYLGKLARDSPSAANAKAYAEIIHRKSVERRLKAAHKAEDAEAVSALQKELLEIGQGERTEKSINAADLMRLNFPPTRWVIPGILPEGLNILAGPPKIGKSWLVLDVAIATATGGRALDSIDVEAGSVLYISLEDSNRRLQRRINKLFVEDPGLLSRLWLVTEWPRLDQGGAYQIEKWIENHPDVRLIIIDTLQRIKPIGNGRNAYAEDYFTGDYLTPITKKHNVSILLIHHTNKRKSDDILESISGTYGLAGSVDGTLILRRDRGAADGFLYVSGREIEDEKDFALDWDKKTAIWRIRGDAEDFKGSDPWIRARELLKDHGPLSALELTCLIHDDPGLNHKSKEFNAAKHLLQRAYKAGKLDRAGSRYSLKMETKSTCNTSSTSSTSSISSTSEGATGTETPFTGTQEKQSTSERISNFSSNDNDLSATGTQGTQGTQGTHTFQNAEFEEGDL